MTQNLKLTLGRIENIVGKGENAGYQHFPLFSQCFQKLSFLGMLKVRTVVELKQIRWQVLKFRGQLEIPEARMTNDYHDKMKLVTHYKILILLKLKAFAGNKINLAKMIVTVIKSLENMMGKL